MKKFLVLSYDDNTQACHWDCVIAADLDAAHKKVAAVRTESVVVEVINPDDLLSLAFYARDTHPDTIEAAWSEIAGQHTFTTVGYFESQPHQPLVFIVQAADIRSAIREAERLAKTDLRTAETFINTFVFAGRCELVSSWAG